MCGIIGIIANNDVVDDLVSGLKRLEYRGYDSAGIAVIDKQKNLSKCRTQGKIKSLEDELEKTKIAGNIGIGHTRWATHGIANTVNAHPHSTEKVSVVHNGIIENYLELRAELAQENIKFYSDTDSEVIPVLFNYYINQGLSIEELVPKTLARLHGAYAIAAIFSAEPDKFIIAKNGSPLAIAFGENANYIGSDAYSLAPLSTKICYLEDGDWAIISRDSAKIFDKNNQEVRREIKESNVSGSAISKGHYKHYMLKEIYEQPSVIGETLGVYYNSVSKEITLPNNDIKYDKIEKINIVACGTSYYAGMIAKYWFEEYAKIEASVEIASEFRYRKPVLKPNSISVFISQSGETIDTLNALRYAKEHGQYTVSIVNVEESSMARESDLVLRNLAGPEIGVASTKAFTTQLITLGALILKFATYNNQIDHKQFLEIIDSMHELPSKILHIIAEEEIFKKLAHNITNSSSILYIGRNTAYPIALEGALKLKELSYIHAEAIAAGELKHGPIALIDENVPVVVIAPNDSCYEKTISNVQEIIAREGKIILISDNCQKENFDNEVVDFIDMPIIHNFVAPILYSIPVQMLAYYVAVKKGTDVDQPRNLAKSVTVE